MIINFNSFLLLEKSNTENFIEKSKKVHGYKYDYSLVDYKSSKKKVKIICTKPSHGIFEQTPSDHLRNSGCPICGIENRKLRSNTEDFIKKSKKVHGDKYDYSLVDYKDNKTKVKIICTKHDHEIFEQTPRDHLQSRGCPICGGNIISNNASFIEKAKNIHGDKYGYSLINYKGAFKKIKIICNIPGHSIFEQNPHNHLMGKGCPICGGTSKSSTENFIEKAKKVHGDKYDYSLVDYKNAKKNVKIICTKHSHEIFEQSPGNHLSGQGCPICQESRGEKIVKNILIKYNIKYDTQKKFDKCKTTRKLPFDFYLPDYNICIEYDGMQHYMEINHFYKGKKTFENRQKIDAIKTKSCLDNRIPLIRIPYTVKDIEEYLMSRIEIIKNGEYDYENGFI